MKRKKPADGRNPYRDGHPNLRRLAQLYPAIEKHMSRDSRGRHRFDFESPDALIALTETLLYHDFGVYATIPRGFLCPPVPQRLNYILWISSLLDVAPSERTTVIDIGTGASCIFPLIGTALFDWCFIATDVSTEAVKHALRNVLQNDLRDRITLHIGQEESLLTFLRPVLQSDCDYVVMTNPPFFGAAEEYIDDENRGTEMRRAEALTRGGELEFAKRIYHEGKHMLDRTAWFTSMFGRKESLKQMLRFLKQDDDITMLRSTTFKQGRRDRWGVAWTYRRVKE